jgi:L-fuconolactonase
MKKSRLQNRRDFLQSTALCLSSVALQHCVLQAEPQESRSIVVDCHAHVYSPDELTYPPIQNPNRPPRGKGTLEHLKHEMKSAGVDLVTAVQTSSFYRWDNHFVTDLSRANPEFMIGICTLDPDESSSPALLQEYVANSNVRGLRSLSASDGRLDHPGVNRLWETAEKLGIVVNSLANRDKRPELETLARRFPKLPVVLDHCLNLRSGTHHEATLHDVLALAALPNVYAKLTFIPTGTAEKYPCRDMHDSCHQVINAYGADRCVWGSQFPCELWCPKISYREHLAIFQTELGLDPIVKRKILGETAQRLWFADR